MLRAFFLKIKSVFFPCRENKYRPKIINNRFLFYYALVFLAFKIIVIPFFIYFPNTIFFASVTENKLIELTNLSRKNLGIEPLKENKELNYAAYLKAKDMIEEGYFSHYSPKGISPWFWLNKAGYDYEAAGENLAIGFINSEQVHRAFMESYSHKENILNRKYQEIGIAVLKGNFQGNETILVIQYFGKEKKASDGVFSSLPEVSTKEEISEIITEEEESMKRTAGERGEMISVAGEKTVRKTPSFMFFQFMISDYYDLLQKIAYGSLIFIIFSLFLVFFCDIFIYKKFKIEYKDVILKGILFLLLWLVLISFDEIVITELIAYNFRIN
ncbi:MAG: CAP domain-containing protein [Candidatus Paceibacterota bacterium]